MTTFKEYLLSEKTKPTPKNVKNTAYPKPMKKRKGLKKGGYPYGTRKGDGGLAGNAGRGGAGFVGIGLGDAGAGGEGGGGVGESVELENKGPQYNSPNSHDLSNNADGVSVIDDEATPVGEFDPNKEGLLRRVPGAHLVYKRQTEEGTFEEMWAFKSNLDEISFDVDVKNAILAGTDIELHTGVSPDGNQSFDIVTFGNAQLIVIKGLPN